MMTKKLSTATTPLCFGFFRCRVDVLQSLFSRSTISFAEFNCLLRNSLRSKFSVWFRSKERPGTGFSVLAAREMKREPKTEIGGRGRGRKEGNFLSSQPPPRSFTYAVFRAAFDSFFVPKPHGNACYAG